MSIVFTVCGDYIQLDQLLKATGLCPSGGHAHAEIGAGRVRVDGAVEMRKRAKLRVGQLIRYGGDTIELIAGVLAEGFAGFALCADGLDSA